MGASLSYSQNLSTSAATFAKIEDLREKLDRKKDEFQQKAQELKSNYDRLIEIWKNEIPLTSTPTSSDEVNNKFDRFLSTMVDLEKKVILVQKGNVNQLASS
nr:6561_t:CDS:2 [Entrophospora candida]